MKPLYTILDTNDEVNNENRNYKTRNKTKSIKRNQKLKSYESLPHFSERKLFNKLYYYKYIK